MSQVKMDYFTCLNCNCDNTQLYKITDGKFIKLINCRKCGEAVDSYVECERSIIITDLIMQKYTAYKHVLFNSSDFRTQFYVKLTLCIILSEGYVAWILTDGYFPEKSIKTHEMEFYTLCLWTLYEMVLFAVVLFLFDYPFSEKRSFSRFTKSIIVGQSGRLIYIPAIVYKQYSSLAFQAFISIFIYVSSVQSYRVISGRGLVPTMVAIGSAFFISLSLTHYLRFLYKYIWMLKDR